MLSEIKKKDTSLRKIEKINAFIKLNETVEKCLPRSGGWGNRECTLSAINWIKPEELTYNMLTIVGNNGIYNWNLLRK